jgi:hypothetical protein
VEPVWIISAIAILIAIGIAYRSERNKRKD